MNPDEDLIHSQNSQEDFVYPSQQPAPEMQPFSAQSLAPRMILEAQDDRDLMYQYASIRRQEMREDPECDQGHMQLHSQVEIICKEWEQYTTESKLRFKAFLKEQKSLELDRQIKENELFNRDIRRMAKEKQQRDYHKKRGMPMSIKAFKDFRATMGVCEVTLKPSEIPSQLRDSQLVLKSGREQVANQCELEIIAKLKDKVGVESWQVTGKRPGNRVFADQEQAHHQMSVAQICKEVDRTELLQQFEKHQKGLVKKKQRNPLDRFTLMLINSLVRDKKLDFKESFEAIEQAWQTLGEEDQAQFDQLDDFDLKFSADKAQRAQQKKKPEGPVRLQIKYQYKDTGMTLDGYCFFAQKMRQLLMQENKKARLKELEQKGKAGGRPTVGQILTQIKNMWEKLSDHDKADYERKAEEINQTMRAQRYCEQSFSDKQYA